MQEKELIEKWEKTGFLSNKSYEQKLMFALKLEDAKNCLLAHDYLDKFQQMVFPLIYRLTEKQNNFNVQLAVFRFHKRFIIGGYELNNIDDEIKYLCDFVDEYEF
jgi:hypothetical protein